MRQKAQVETNEECLRQDAKEEEEEHIGSNLNAENPYSLGNYFQQNHNLDKERDYAVNKPADYSSFMMVSRSAWQLP